MLRRLPPGILVDSARLRDQRLSRSSIHGYVARGWLDISRCDFTAGQPTDLNPMPKALSHELPNTRARLAGDRV